MIDDAMRHAGHGRPCLLSSHNTEIAALLVQQDDTNLPMEANTTKTVGKANFRELVSHFENNIKENGERLETSCSPSFITHFAAGKKGKEDSSTTETKKKRIPATLPRKTPKAINVYATSESCPSLTSSESDNSSVASAPKPPKIANKGQHRTGSSRLFTNVGNLSGIPESATVEDSKAVLEMSLVLKFDDESCLSPRRSSTVGGSQTSWEEDTSTKSSISRMSPKIRSLPRDLDFDESESSNCTADDDSEVLGECMKLARNKPSRFW